jgi:hypothetical protein
MRFGLRLPTRSSVQRKVVRGLRQGLGEDERYEVADRAVDELKR